MHSIRGISRPAVFFSLIFFCDPSLIMGCIISCIQGIFACIGDAIMCIISAIASVLECIVGAITGLFTGIADCITAILCCGRA
ncbi:hypothetical protein FA95DRAFT_1512439 [Auriscalpium vulgare]|uniref:Uncharacterized protein n=1 Tax=Auriscalpium vulgare TaxID=40419 RepID=A0ACB8S5X5_9AGAM|nr:hypothetical protein FA95DRAFT_1512439 [Auriscalpium vulgare]